MWGQSLVGGDASVAESDYFVELLWPSLFPPLHDLFLSPEQFGYFIRKCAHFSEYAIWTLLAYRTFTYESIKTKTHQIVSVLLTGLCVAIADECIQLFVPGRAGLFSDVLIDFSAIALVSFFFFMQVKRQN